MTGGRGARITASEQVTNCAFVPRMLPKGLLKVKPENQHPSRKDGKENIPQT